MRVEIIDHRDCWQEVKDSAMNTIGKETGKYPTPAWKRKILLAEHGPIRLFDLKVRIVDVKYWVAMHLVRHELGVRKDDQDDFISTQRSDRTGIDRDHLPQGELVDYTFKANASAFIYISRRRLCGQASPETRAAWRAVVNAVKAVEPELASVCVPECVYRGFCPEMKCCGYFGTPAYEIERQAYVTGSMVTISSKPPAGE